VRDIQVKIDCEDKECGVCKYREDTDIGWGCVIFHKLLDYKAEMRLPECIKAEIKRKASKEGSDERHGIQGKR
jgi:hypothetical protein